MTIKCPFYVVEEFVSPLMCEEIIDRVNFTVPNTDKEGHEVATIKTSDAAEEFLYTRFQTLIPELTKYYGLTYKGMERISFEWYPPGSQGKFVCENSEYLRKKWLRTRARDITSILFLSDYNEHPPFDSEYEVYGGKLEFNQHAFGFNPTRGTLITFPSDPHFINITSPVYVGELYQARIQLASTTPFIYQPNDYQGNYTTWFRDKF